eukprot:gene14011-18792_t
MDMRRLSSSRSDDGNILIESKESIYRSYVPEILSLKLQEVSSNDSFSNQDVLNSIIDTHNTTHRKKLSSGNPLIPNVEPKSWFINGAVLVVDISGFTRLSGQYCSKGKYGIDELQLATNGYIGQLCEVVYEYGGDIMKFAGDALITVFSEQTINMSKATRSTADHILNSSNEDTKQNQYPNEFLNSSNEDMKQYPNEVSGIINVIKPKNANTNDTVLLTALLCAMKLQSMKTNVFTAHIGLSAGEMCCSILGGNNDRWEFIMAGECLGDISSCLDDAPSQKTCVSSTYFDKFVDVSITKKFESELLPSRCLIVHGIKSIELSNKLLSLSPIKNSTSRGICTRTDLNSGLCSIATSFIPLPVTIGVNGGMFEYMAEIKEVTTMFMRWDSYDPLIHRDLLSLQPSFLIVQTIIFQTGGFIRQFLVDDKGCVLIVCWGVPSASYIDNTLRAVQSAIQIRMELKSMGMESSFGITTGNVYCGSIGCPIRREYSVIGDVVNLAARLMAKAKGSILINDSSKSRLPVHCYEGLIQLQPMHIKGKSELITVYSFRPELLPIQCYENSMLKHDYEVRQSFKTIVIAYLETMTKVENAKLLSLFGKNKFEKLCLLKLVLVEGKAGSGKSTAVKWLIQQARLSNIRTVSLRIDSNDSYVNYKVIQKLFRLLIKEENYDNLMRQKLIITHILESLYQTDTTTAVNVGYASMNLALGVTCPIKLGGHTIVSDITNRIAPELIQSTLLKVFDLLMCMDEPILIVIEHIHLADELSLKILQSMSRLKCKSMILYTAISAMDDKLEQQQQQLKTQSLRFVDIENTNRYDALSSSKRNRGHILTNFWYNSFRNEFVQNNQINYIVFKDYTLVELNLIIKSTFIEMIQELMEKGIEIKISYVAELVYQTTGGNHFWVNELVQYIKHIGIEKFIRESSSFVTSSNSNSSLDTYLRQETRHAVTVLDSQSEQSNKNNKIKMQSNTPKIMSINTTDTMSPATALTNISKITGNNTPFLEEQLVKDQFGTNQINNHNNILEDSHHIAKLELFIICRFENLDPDEQFILRTASTIGFQFSRYVLCGVLPDQLKSSMNRSLRKLIEEKWITQSLNDDSEYFFGHRAVYRSIYELTPSSEREALHLTIAQFIENMSNRDPSQYWTLFKHYSQCMPSKGFEYAICSIEYLISPEKFNLEDVFHLLHKTVHYCQSVMDADTILYMVDIVIEQINLKRDNNNNNNNFVEESSLPDNIIFSNNCCLPIHFFRNNKISPKINIGNISISNHSKSNNSVVEDSSHIALNDLILFKDSILHLRMKLQEDNLIGKPTEWQSILLKLEKSSSQHDERSLPSINISNFVISSIESIGKRNIIHDNDNNSYSSLMKSNHSSQIKR